MKRPETVFEELTTISERHARAFLDEYVSSEGVLLYTEGKLNHELKAICAAMTGLAISDALLNIKGKRLSVRDMALSMADSFLALAGVYKIRRDDVASICASRAIETANEFCRYIEQLAFDRFRELTRGGDNG